MLERTSFSSLDTHGWTRVGLLVYGYLTILFLWKNDWEHIVWVLRLVTKEERVEHMLKREKIHGAIGASNVVKKFFGNFWKKERQRNQHYHGWGWKSILCIRNNDNTWSPTIISVYQSIISKLESDLEQEEYVSLRHDPYTVQWNLPIIDP